VHDVTQAVEVALLIKNFFCHLDGIYHAKAKAGVVVYLYLQVFHVHINF
jgi:hypothetical protein